MRNRRVAAIVTFAVSLAAAPVAFAAAEEAAERAAIGAPEAETARRSALAQARASGQRVAVAELTTETQQVWAMPDGQLLSEITAGPVRVKRDGLWVAVDLTLHKSPDGSVAPAVHRHDLVLSGGGNEDRHDLVALGAGTERRVMTWAGRLPAPLLDGARATYPEVSQGIDLVVEARMTGYEQFVVVRDRAAVARVPAVLAALTVGDNRSISDGQGGLTHSGAVEGHTPQPLMWDAAVDPSTGTPANIHPVSLVPAEAGWRLAADAAWLADPSRSFPITIDPSDEPRTDRGDTWVQEGSSTKRWTYADLQIGTQNSGITRRTAYINVTAQGMTQATVHKAELRLWATDMASGGSCVDGQWQVFGAQTNANDNTVWSNRPYLIDGHGNWIGSQNGNGAEGAYGKHPFGASVAPSGGGCTNRWVHADVRGLFQYAATSGWWEFTAVLTAMWDNTNVFHKKFASYEAGPNTVPYAVVSYSFKPTIARRDIAPSVPCVTGSNLPVVGTATPTLSAAFNATDGVGVDVHFEYGEVGGSTTTIRYLPVASGETANYRIPAGELVDGRSYRWQTYAKSWLGVWSDPSGWCEFTVDSWAPKVAGCPGNATDRADFNGDGTVDTAIADPLRTAGGVPEAGAVHIVDGRTAVLSTLDASLPEVPGVPESGDRFGASLAVVDMNVDGCADLAVGVPYRNSGSIVDAGVVYLFYGTPTGLAKGPAAEAFAQGTNRIPGTQQHSDSFGYALTSGRTRAGEPYLVVGAPRDDVGGADDAGTVTYIRGEYRLMLDQSVAAPQSAELDDRGGYALASTPDHFAVGYPGESRDADTQLGGAVCVFTHTISANRPGVVGCWDQSSTGVSDSMEAGDMFGKSISMARYRAVGEPDGTDSILVVGVPGEDYTGAPDTGIVQQFRIAGTTLTELPTITQNVAGVSDSNESGDLFGEKVIVVNTSPSAEVGPGTLLLAIGSPGEDVGSAVDRGRVVVVPAGTSAFSADVSVERRMGSLPGVAASRELVGVAVGASTTHLYVPSAYAGSRAVYAIAWSDLAAGSSVVAVTTTAPAGAVGFGAQVG
jgi:hypothetical protein